MIELLRGLLNSNAVNRLGWTLMHSLWEAALAGIIVGVALRAMKGISAAARYAAATAGLALVVVLIAVTFVVVGPRGSGEVAPTSRENMHAVGEAPVFATDSLRTGERTEDIRGANTVPAKAVAAIPFREQAAEFVGRFQPVFPWMVGLWTLGVLALCAWHIGGWIAMQRLRTLGVEAAEDRIHTLLARMKNRLGVSRAVRVMTSALVQVPLVIGHVRPLILIPAAVLTGLPTEQLEAIIAHELAHIRRHDYLVNLAQVLIETLLFYHPAVWWISKQIRREREHCCDDLAAAVVGDRLTYAEALVSVASLHGPVNGLAMAATGGTMLPRIRRVLGVSEREVSRRPASLAAILATLLLVMLPLLNAHPAAHAASASTEPATETVIHGKVLEAGTEKPVVGARVDMHGAGHEGVSFTTDNAGEFTCHVPTGTWQFEFGEVPQNYYLTAGQDDQGREVQIAADPTIREKTMTLHVPPLLPIGAIHGKVVLPDGSAASGILVVPSAEASGGPRTVEGLIYLNAKKADADGRFSFATAPASACRCICMRRRRITRWRLRRRYKQNRGCRTRISAHSYCSQPQPPMF